MEIPPEEPVHLFCDSANIVASKESFLLALRSGGELHAFMFSPNHAKRLLAVLQNNINAYEKEFGELDGRLGNEPLLSPLQGKDLGGSTPDGVTDR